MDCTNSVRFKRGDTFDFSGPVQVNQDGAAVANFAGWEARSHVRDVADRLVAELAVTWISVAPGAIRLVATSTASWPDLVDLDVEFIAPDGSRVSTETQRIVVTKDQTR